jgi:ribosomal protein L11 methylase PrmA
VEATLRNARDNGVVLDAIERHDLRREEPHTADVIAANLMRPLLLQLRQSLRGMPRCFIASGLLEAEADEIAAAYAPMRERRRLVDRGWAALLLARTTPAPR